jgi:hypothetical protein
LKTKPGKRANAPGPLTTYRVEVGRWLIRIMRACFLAG